MSGFRKSKDTVEVIQIKEMCQDLLQRIILVEGERKANYETSFTQIKQNAEIIRQIKQENNNCRQQITAIHGENKGSGKKVDQLTQKQNQLKQINKQLNEILHQNRSTTEEITKLNSAVASARHNAKNPKDPNAADVRQQRTLSNRLDKAMIKYNEAMSIKKTYETIRKRLQDDRISFDNQLQSLERTLKSKEKDYEELLLLSHDAYHAKEMAQAELHRFEQGVMEERNQRDREVAEKKALVQQRVEMNTRLEAQQQTVKHYEQIDEMANTAVKTTASVSIEAQKTTITERDDQANILKDFADAFKKLKEVTGISDAPELVQKMSNQRQTFKDLNQMKEDNERKIRDLIHQRFESKRVLEKLKFQGTGDGKTKPTQTVSEKNKELLDFKLELKNISQALNTKKEKLATSTETLNNLKSSIDHLYQKLYKTTYHWPSLSQSGTAISVGYYEELSTAFDDALTHIEKKIEWFTTNALIDAISTDEAIKIYENGKKKKCSTLASHILVQENLESDNDDGDEEPKGQGRLTANVMKSKSASATIKKPKR